MPICRTRQCVLGKWLHRPDGNINNIFGSKYCQTANIHNVAEIILIIVTSMNALSSISAKVYSHY